MSYNQDDLAREFLKFVKNQLSVRAEWLRDERVHDDKEFEAFMRMYSLFEYLRDSVNALQAAKKSNDDDKEIAVLSNVPKEVQKVIAMTNAKPSVQKEAIAYERDLVMLAENYQFFNQSGEVDNDLMKRWHEVLLNHGTPDKKRAILNDSIDNTIKNNESASFKAQVGALNGIIYRIKQNKDIPLNENVERNLETFRASIIKKALKQIGEISKENIDENNKLIMIYNMLYGGVKGSDYQGIQDPVALMRIKESSQEYLLVLQQQAYVEIQRNLNKEINEKGLVGGIEYIEKIQGEHKNNDWIRKQLIKKREEIEQKIHGELRKIKEEKNIYQKLSLLNDLLKGAVSLSNENFNAEIKEIVLQFNTTGKGQAKLLQDNLGMIFNTPNVDAYKRLQLVDYMLQLISVHTTSVSDKDIKAAKEKRLLYESTKADKKRESVAKASVTDEDRKAAKVNKQRLALENLQRMDTVNAIRKHLLVDVMRDIEPVLKDKSPLEQLKILDYLANIAKENNLFDAYKGKLATMSLATISQVAESIHQGSVREFLNIKTDEINTKGSGAFNAYTQYYNGVVETLKKFILSAENKNDCCSRIEQVILIAQELFNKGNMDMYSAVWDVLQADSEVQRLKLIPDALSKNVMQYYDNANKILDMGGNHFNRGFAQDIIKNHQSLVPFVADFSRHLATASEDEKTYKETKEKFVKIITEYQSKLNHNSEAPLFIMDVFSSEKQAKDQSNLLRSDTTKKPSAHLTLSYQSDSRMMVSISQEIDLAVIQKIIAAENSDKAITLFKANLKYLKVNPQFFIVILHGINNPKLLDEFEKIIKNEEGLKNYYNNTLRKLIDAKRSELSEKSLAPRTATITERASRQADDIRHKTNEDQLKLLDSITIQLADIYQKAQDNFSGIDKKDSEEVKRLTSQLDTILPLLLASQDQKIKERAQTSFKEFTDVQTIFISDQIKELEKRKNELAMLERQIKKGVNSTALDKRDKATQEFEQIKSTLNLVGKNDLRRVTVRSATGKAISAFKAINELDANVDNINTRINSDLVNKYREIITAMKQITSWKNQLDEGVSNKILAAITILRGLSEPLISQLKKEMIDVLVQTGLPPISITEAQDNIKEIEGWLNSLNDISRKQVISKTDQYASLLLHKNFIAENVSLCLTSTDIEIQRKALVLQQQSREVFDAINLKYKSSEKPATEAEQKESPASPISTSASGSTVKAQPVSPASTPVPPLSTPKSTKLPMPPPSATPVEYIPIPPVSTLSETTLNSGSSSTAIPTASSASSPRVDNGDNSVVELKQETPKDKRKVSPGSAEQKGFISKLWGKLLSVFTPSHNEQFSSSARITKGMADLSGVNPKHTEQTVKAPLPASAASSTSTHAGRPNDADHKQSAKLRMSEQAQTQTRARSSSIKNSRTGGGGPAPYTH